MFKRFSIFAANLGDFEGIFEFWDFFLKNWMAREGPDLKPPSLKVVPGTFS